MLTPNNLLRCQRPSQHLDLSMVLNGALAGLVGVTAGADQLGILDAVATGLIAGFLVVAVVLLFDRKLKIDDPVGAISVHLVCGIWGTLAVGLFGSLASPSQLLSLRRALLPEPSSCSRTGAFAFRRLALAALPSARSVPSAPCAPRS